MTHYSKSELLIRYLRLAAGLFIMALGISLSVKANLGTSPISSVPYVLSEILPLTIGQCTILLHSALVLLQIALLRRDFQLIQLLQVPVAVVFGGFTDLTMVLLSWVQPEGYLIRWVCVAISILLIGVGVVIEVRAGVILLAGEGAISAIAKVTGQEFGKTKVCFDTTLVIIAILLGFIFLHRLAGVREGTIAAALLVGMVTRVINLRIMPRLFPAKEEAKS